MGDRKESMELDDTATRPQGSARRPVIRLVLLGLFVAAVASVGFLLVPHDVEQIRAWSGQVGAPGVVLFTLLYAALTLSPAPKNVLGIAAGLVWGFPVAFAMVYIGALLGAAASFALGRALGREAVERFTGARVARLDAAIGRRGMPAVLGARLVPVIPFTLINYGAGLTSVRRRDYAIGTAVGIIPGSAAYVALGAFGWELGPWLWVALSVVGVLLIGGVVAGTLVRRRRAEGAADA
jgi:uncharacterized membrane protein YdjX (TVP38/TMEM64 family)